MEYIIKCYLRKLNKKEKEYDFLSLIKNGCMEIAVYSLDGERLVERPHKIISDGIKIAKFNMMCYDEFVNYNIVEYLVNEKSRYVIRNKEEKVNVLSHNSFERALEIKKRQEDFISIPICLGNYIIEESYDPEEIFIYRKDKKFFIVDQKT